MKITRKQAIALLEAFSFAGASGWNKPRMLKQINTLDEEVDESLVIEDAATQEVLDGVLAAIKKGTKIDVVKDVATKAAPPAKAAPAKAAPAKAAPAKAKAAPAKAAKAKAAPAKAAPAKPTRKRKAKPAPAEVEEVVAPKPKRTPKAKAAPAVEDGTFPGIHDKKTRHYVAGQIIAEVGLDAGCTPELVKRLDDAMDKPNPKESRFQYSKAWHSIRGYLDALEGTNRHAE